MTLNEAQEKLLNVARKELGYHEGYNNYIKYAEGNWDNQFYGWELQNQPWCDVFVDYCFCTAFGMQNGAAMTYQKVGSGSALCSASAAYYKNNKAYYSYPEVGDQVFFYYSGDINHTGIVESVKGSKENWTSFTTIEGNSGDRVARQTYGRGNASVAGFGRPKWSVVVNSSEPTAPAGVTPVVVVDDDNEPASQPKPTQAKLYYPYIYNVKINLLKEGNYGPQVSSMQQLLKEKGFPCEVTGKFDKKTKQAIIEFQKAVGEEADGEFGGATFTALWNY